MLFLIFYRQWARTPTEPEIMTFSCQWLIGDWWAIAYQGIAVNQNDNYCHNPGWQNKAKVLLQNWDLLQ